MDMNASRSSLHSEATSTRPIMQTDRSLDPPAPPFTGTASSRPSSSITLSQLTPKKGDDRASVSLSVNYLPSKFSSGLLEPGPRKRKNNGQGGRVPKRGGGIDAFKSGEARVAGAGDEDYDGVSTGWLGGANKGKPGKKRMRWTRFKWILLFANILLTIYSITALIFCLITYFNGWENASIVRIGNQEELALSTLAASLGIVTCLLGWAGIVLNNRAFLAVYSFMLWITFAFLVTPGYVTYKKHTFNLEGKTNKQWSRDLGMAGRLNIQNQLSCCGYFSPFIEATISQTCYSRSILPGCKLPYMDFERGVLKKWYIAAFALVPVHIFVMVSALLCSNHVTYRFGKGMMPKAYRLSMNSMAVIMDNYANELAGQYGTDSASQSRSNLNLADRDSMMSMPYASSLSGTPAYAHTKYDSVGAPQ